MCGIVGLIGNNVLYDTIIALQKIEYRGYDSSGISIFDEQNKIKTFKKVGKINVLKGFLKDNKINGNISIAHTRWCTHGGISEENAHPHTSGCVSLVHNGIIENYLEIKKELINNGAKFESQTDSESIVHLINSYSGSLKDRVFSAAQVLEGTYAIAVISEDEPDKIVVAKKFSPMVVGLFENGAIVASDIQSIISYTDSVYILEDNDIAVVYKNHIEIFNNNVLCERMPTIVPYKYHGACLGNNETYMIKEIHEQPLAIINTVAGNDWENISYIIKNMLCGIKEVLFVACGTSFHAGLIGAMFVEQISGMKSNARLASEFLFTENDIDSGSLVIAISQSGETADTLSAVNFAKRRGAQVVSVVNVLGSSIERASDFCIKTSAGPEISVASTKSFISQLTILYILAYILCKEEYPINFGKIFDNLKDIADKINFIFETEKHIEYIAKNICDAASMLYVGRGIGVPIALEAALKMKEISYIHAEGMSAGELKHGTISLVDATIPTVAIVQSGMFYNKILSNIQEIKARRGKVIAIAEVKNENLSNIVDDIVYVPKVDGLLFVFLSIIPLQLLAYYVAKTLGREIDMPKNLAKSVTVE